MAKEIDFTKRERRDALERAEKLLIRGFRILHDEVEADNPADNAFLREAQICAKTRLIWVGDRGGADARTKAGDEVEIKSTRLDERPSIQFPTSRSVSPTVIARFRKASFWLFGVFDIHQEVVAIYRVEAVDMRPSIDELERRMKLRKRKRQREENNPKLRFVVIRPKAKKLFLRSGYVEKEDPKRGWTIKQR